MGTAEAQAKLAVLQSGRIVVPVPARPWVRVWWWASHQMQSDAAARCEVLECQTGHRSAAEASEPHRKMGWAPLVGLRAAVQEAAWSYGTAASESREFSVTGTAPQPPKSDTVFLRNRRRRESVFAGVNVN